MQNLTKIERMSVMKEDNRTRCEVYSRVVGFLSPVSQWNKGKKEEFSDRLTFDRSTGQDTVKKA
nr:anaerobic ribonucleoside-triphosphate reductase [uncultured Dethiosulfovibrio sp.]